MKIYEKPVLFAILSVAVISVGTLVTTFIPLFLPSTQPTNRAIRPYSAIETEGRDIYLREGCNNCHTQTVRPLRTEVARYGEYSKPEEFAYDRPFLWGSRRTGPDLARIGGRYPDSWHYQHTADPQGMFPKSNMPHYAWLARRTLDTAWTARKVSVLRYGYDAAEVARQIGEFRQTVTSKDYPSAGARDACASSTCRMIRATVLSEAGLVTSMSSAPSTTTDPAKTSFPGSRGTGMLSPVTGDSSTDERPSTTLPSTGTLSPGRTRNRSPT